MKIKKLKIVERSMEPGKKYGVNLYSTRDVMYRYGGDIYFRRFRWRI